MSQGGQSVLTKVYEIYEIKLNKIGTPYIYIMI